MFVLTEGGRKTERSYTAASCIFRRQSLHRY